MAILATIATSELGREGGVVLVILFLSDPGGKRGEIRNRAMSGLGARWAVGGRRTGVSGGVGRVQ